MSTLSGVDTWPARSGLATTVDIVHAVRHSIMHRPRRRARWKKGGTPTLDGECDRNCWVLSSNHHLLKIPHVSEIPTRNAPHCSACFPLCGPK